MLIVMGNGMMWEEYWINCKRKINRAKLGNNGLEVVYNYYELVSDGRRSNNLI